MPLQNILSVRDPTEAEGRSKSRDNTASAGTKRKRTEIDDDPKAQARREVAKQKREKRLVEEAEAQQRKLCVGVDMGTTYSGAAYVSNANRSKPPEIISRWGKGQQAFQDKVPSTIAYAKDNDFKKDRWGCSVKSSHKAVHWWKLLLDEETDPAAYDDPTLATIVADKILELPEGKTAKDVATDYLRCIYGHILSHLEGVLGPALRVTPLVFCLTVPATWSPLAREMTKAAAVDAGFTSRPDDELLLVDEPQSAITDVLHSTIHGFNKDQQPFQKGTSALCCDLGGGTLDFITYKIKELDPLTIEEACIGAGAKAGATTVDREFWKWCQRIFGVAFTDVPLKDRATGSKFMLAFEILKQAFEGAHSDEQDADLEVPLKMKKLDMDNEEVCRHYDESEGTIKFTPKEMQDFYAPVLKSAFKLVKDQIAKTEKARMPKVETVVLVGGLAQNAWVRYSFEKFVKKELGDNIKCLSPERSWAAIARGAAISAREKKIVEYRRLRDNLGYPVLEPFDEDIHEEADKVQIGNKTRARVMHWSFKRGRKLYPGSKETMPWYAMLEDDKKSGAVVVDQQLYSNPEDVAPKRLDESCKLAGSLKLNLTGAARSLRAQRKKERKPDDELLEIDVKVDIMPASDKGCMFVRARTGTHKEVGSVTITYDADSSAGVKMKKR